MKDITSIPLVVPLRCADAAGTRDVGGKGANLANDTKSSARTRRVLYSHSRL